MNTQAVQDLGRKHWLEERRRGIGGTDAAAILGVHPWKTAFEVWLEKTGRVTDAEQSKAMKWGLLLEDTVAQEYTRRTGRKVWNPERLMTHPEHPCIVGTPDRLVLDEDRGLDIKTSSAYQHQHWGEEETDEIPPHYLVQAAQYMAITGFPVWDVFVLIGGNDDRLYTVKRDLSFEAILIQRLVEWWERYVVRDEQPPVDSSEGAKAYIAQLFPNHPAPRIPATPEAQDVGEALLTVTGQMKALEAEKETYRSRLRLLVGDAKGMDGKGWRATWCGGNEKKVVDHELLCKELMHLLKGQGLGERITSAVTQCTIVKKTPVSFRFTAEGEGGDR